MKQNNRGVLLVEALLTVAVLSAGIVTVVQAMAAMSTANQKMETAVNARVEQENNFLAEWIRS